jgi:hypothetical protein
VSIRTRPVSGRAVGVAVSVLVLLLAFLFVTLVYELASYRGYLSLYARRGLATIAFSAGQVLSRPGSDAEKAAALSALASETMKDPSVADVWFTDKDFRLLYSADPELLKSFRFQKLPASFYPLYKDGFSAAASGKGFRVVENRSLDDRYVYLVVPVKVASSSFFDYTAGLKLRKISFLAVQEALFSTPWFPFHPGVATAWFVMFLFALLASWQVGRMSSSLYEDALELLDRYAENAGGETSATVFETPSRLLRPFAAKLADISAANEERIKKRTEESGQKIRSSGDEEARRNLASLIFPPPQETVKGLTYAAAASGSEGRISSFTMVRQTTAFQSFVGVALAPSKKPDAFGAAAAFAYSAFYRIISGAAPADALGLLNIEFRTAYLEPSPVMTAQFGLADNIVTLSLAGFRGVLYHNARSGEAAVFPSCGLPVGKSAGEDFTVAFRQEKIRLESGDSLLFFNDAYLEAASIASMKEALVGSRGRSAEETIPELKGLAGSGPDAFVMLVKKT